jgi:hypothetical protein
MSKGAMLTCGLLLMSAARADEPVTLRTLLAEMVDRDGLARDPAPAYALRQASSYDRHKTDPADAAGWHSNHDYEQFIRTETNGGRREWVIMEHDGPGAVTRFWLPLEAGHDAQMVRFYFDGAAEPAIAVKFNELLGGRGFVKPPLAFTAWNETDLGAQLKAAPKVGRGVGGDMYLPIPYAKSCKITLDSLPFYYGINYRAYAPGTAVRTFTMADCEAAAPDLARVGAELLTSPRVDTEAKSATLAPGAELALDPGPGPAAIESLQVHLDPKDAPQALRTLVLSGAFDGEEALWCPVGDFFGCGPRLRAVHDRFRSVEEDGTLSAWWVMPYQTSARLALRNLGATPLTVTFAAGHKPWPWDERSLHFHATWHGELGLKTRPMSDFNYLEAHGRGVYCGDTLTVYTPEAAWYGEGDERIYREGERVASHIGTGTEDYYGYAWGMANFFSSPWLAMPRRDGKDRGDWRGYTTTSRLRALDAIPFHDALKVDMEIWNWADTAVDYAAAAFWYARPGVKHNRQPQPDIATAPLKAAPEEFKIAGALECEDLRVVAISPGLKYETQTGGLREGRWSGGAHLWVRAAQVGDLIELEVPVGDNQPRRVALYATKSWDYGIVRFSLNGQPAGADLDSFDLTPKVAGPLDLGAATPRDGKLLLRAEVVGRNEGSKGFFFGLDCVVLAKP